MKLLDQYEAACKVRRLAPRTIQTYRRWVEEFLRFHHDRTGGWIHPQDMGEREVEAFLTHLAVNRRVAESTQNQALGAILFLYRHVLSKDLGSLDAVRANRPKRLPTVLSKDEVRRLKYRYYTDGGYNRGGRSVCLLTNIPADALEVFVVGKVRDIVLATTKRPLKPSTPSSRLCSQTNARARVSNANSNGWPNASRPPCPC